MSERDATIAADVRRAVLGGAAARIAGSLHAAGSARGDLLAAARKLAAAGLPTADVKRLDDTAQLVRHAEETLAQADALLRRVASDQAPPAPAAHPHEQAEPGGYYDFAGYAPELGGEGG